VGAADPDTSSLFPRFTRGDGERSFEHEIVVRVLPVIVPGDALAGCKGEHARLDVGSLQDGLDALHGIIL